MSQAQAARTSLAEIRHLVEGHNRGVQEMWEIARWMRWHAVQLSPDIKPFNKPHSPRLMMRFPWEEPEQEITPQDCHVTEEEARVLEAIMEDLKRRKAEQTS